MDDYGERLFAEHLTGEQDGVADPASLRLPDEDRFATPEEFAANEELLLQATLARKQLLVDLSAFDPKEGEAFYWIVSSGEDQSEKAHFTFSEEDKKGKEALQKVLTESIYQEADKAERFLMEAVALKDAGLSQQALQKLNEAAVRFPENRSIEKMMDSFIVQLKQE